MGQSKWDELIRMEANIRKQRQETLYRQRERRRKFVEIIAIAGCLIFGAFALSLFVWFLMQRTKV
jgi:hypothetical protein